MKLPRLKMNKNMFIVLIEFIVVALFLSTIVELITINNFHLHTSLIIIYSLCFLNGVYHGVLFGIVAEEA